jgi:tetratricopeptide (TPR) repeat protein
MGNQTIPTTAGSKGLSANDHVDVARRVCSRDAGLAARHLYEALRLEPEHPHAHSLLARYLFEVRMPAEALQHSKRAEAALPNDREVMLHHLMVLETLGMTDEAMKSLAPHFDAPAGASSIAEDPDLIIMFARFAPQASREIQALAWIDRRLASQPLTPAQRKGLHMQAGLLLDRLGRYDEAFDQVRRAHAADPLPFDAQLFRRQVAHQASWFGTAERLLALPKATHAWTQPVFIVGMPRSGSSLLEQLLDAHPEVAGAGELVDMKGIAYHIDRRSGGAYPAFLARATPAELDAVAGLYLSRVAAMAPSARCILDKQLFNWLHLGVISRLFPQARVLHVVRDPLDTCLSCYMTHMQQTIINAADLRQLGVHYNEHRALMSHWRHVLEIPILEVSYEALVAEPEAQVRRILSFLGLPWDERCLRFHDNRRAVITSSMHQVRRPMYSSSVGRWKHYDKHLGPLKAGLATPSVL